MNDVQYRIGSQTFVGVRLCMRVWLYDTIDQCSQIPILGIPYKGQQIFFETLLSLNSHAQFNMHVARTTKLKIKSEHHGLTQIQSCHCHTL